MIRNYTDKLTQTAEELFLIYLDIFRDNLKSTKGRGWSVEVIPMASILSRLVELEEAMEDADIIGNTAICDLAKEVINGCMEEINECC